jgi:hypothetical protein
MSLGAALAQAFAALATAGHGIPESRCLTTRCAAMYLARSFSHAYTENIAEIRPGFTAYARVQVCLKI